MTYIEYLTVWHPVPSLTTHRRSELLDGVNSLRSSVADGNVLCSWIFVTDGSGDKRYDHLPSYWEKEVEIIAQLNNPELAKLINQTEVCCMLSVQRPPLGAAEGLCWFAGKSGSAGGQGHAERIIVRRSPSRTCAPTREVCQGCGQEGQEGCSEGQGRQ